MQLLPRTIFEARLDAPDATEREGFFALDLPAGGGLGLFLYVDSRRLTGQPTPSFNLSLEAARAFARVLLEQYDPDAHALVIAAEHRGNLRLVQGGGEGGAA